MPKITERWLLFKCVGGEFTPLSKPLKTKERAEKARLKYPERERKAIGIGAIRTRGWSGFLGDLGNLFRRGSEKSSQLLRQRLLQLGISFSNAFAAWSKILF